MMRGSSSSLQPVQRRQLNVMRGSSSNLQPVQRRMQRLGQSATPLRSRTLPHTMPVWLQPRQKLCARKLRLSKRCWGNMALRRPQHFLAPQKL